MCVCVIKGLGLHVDGISDIGYVLLYGAGFGSRLDCVNALIKAGAFVSFGSTDKTITSLHLASLEGRIDGGRSISTFNGTMDLPLCLHLASLKGHIEVACINTTPCMWIGDKSDGEFWSDRHPPQWDRMCRRGEQSG